MLRPFPHETEGAVNPATHVVIRLTGARLEPGCILSAPLRLDSIERKPAVETQASEAGYLSNS